MKNPLSIKKANKIYIFKKDRNNVKPNAPNIPDIDF